MYSFYLKPGAMRKIGGQPGHKGINRSKLPSDEVIDIPFAR